MRSLPFAREQAVEIDEHRRAVVLAGADRERAPGGRLDREAHHGLVDRADLLDIERAVGEPLARSAAHCSVIKPSRMRRMQPSETGRTRGGSVGSARPSRKGNCSGSNSLPPRAWMKSLWMALVDQPEQREQAAPGAAPLVHGVGIERGVLGETWHRDREAE